MLHARIAAPEKAVVSIPHDAGTESRLSLEESDLLRWLIRVRGEAKLSKEFGVSRFAIVKAIGRLPQTQPIISHLRERLRIYAQRAKKT